MYEIEDRTLSAQPVCVITGKLPAHQIPNWLPEVYGRVFAYLTKSGVEPLGPPFARYRPINGELEIEAGFPVESPLPGEGDIHASMFPPGPAAATWHIGPYEEMTTAYEAISYWITKKGARPEGPAWEVYHSDPQLEPPSKWRTEILQPYRMPSSRNKVRRDYR